MLAPGRSRSAAVLWGYAGPGLRSQGSFGEDRRSRGARGVGLIAGSSLFSVVFKPAGFIGFRTVTDGWLSATRRPPEDFLGRDRSPSGPVCGGAISAAVRVCRRGAFGEIAPPRRYLGEVGFSATRRPPEDLLGRDRSPSGPVLRRSTRLSEATAQRNPRLNISKKTGSWKVASEWPKVVPKTRALPKPLTQATG
jgi:hypothetical protein